MRCQTHQKETVIMTGSRRNVRAALNTQVIIQGADRSGKSFQITGESVDFSRRGIGLVVPQDLVAPGTVVSLSMPDRFRANAVVQWVRKDESTGQVRLGARMLDTKVSVGLRIAASFLLCLALLGQISFARSRGAAGQANSACTMSLARMKSVLESRLGQQVEVTDAEKTFVHLQHERISCAEYTKAYEKSNFHADKTKRSAVARWHWNQYHADDATIRDAAIESAQSIQAGSN